MVFGNEVTLFSPKSKESLLSSALEKEKEKTYNRKESDWKPDENLYLMSDEEISKYQAESSREIAKIMDSIFENKATPEDFSFVSTMPLYEDTLVSREAAIRSGDVQIMNLHGQTSRNFEYLGDDISRKVWEFEPHPDFEKIVGQRESHGTVETVSKVNEKRLWQFLEETAESEKKKDITFPDIKNLTPIEALHLVHVLIKKRMNYEHLIVGGDYHLLANEIKLENLSTSRNDLLDLSHDGTNKLDTEVKKLKKNIDQMSADELLEYRYGVCRHFAATAQVLYDLLKKKQDGLLMNGSYLVYHDEGVGKQDEKGLVENHAYNILVCTSPKDSGKVEVAMSVIDPTKLILDRGNESTSMRLSQAISFLSEYGSILGIKENDSVCRNLAKQAAERLSQHMTIEHNLYSINDYASLLVQTEEYNEKAIVQELKEVFFNIRLKKVEFLNLLFDCPVISTKKMPNERILRRSYREAVVNEIKEFNFVDIFYQSEVDSLVNKMESTINNTNQKWIKKRRFLVNLNRKEKLSDKERSLFSLVNEFIRASFEADREPKDMTKKNINTLIEIDEKGKNGLISEIWIDKYRAMCDSYETK